MTIYEYHQDAGHGWIKIPHTLIIELGIDKIISSYSYMDMEFAYLEEDADTQTFITAMQEQKDIDVEFKDIYDGNSSPIRNKRGYKTVERTV